MNVVSIYLNNQFMALVKYVLFVVVPFALFLKFSPYPLPYLHFALIALLIVFHYFLFDEKSYRKQIQSKVSAQLQKVKNTTPSQKEINRVINLVLDLRVITLGLVSILILGCAFFL